MKNVIQLAVYAGVGLYDKMREEVEELVRRGELKRHEGDALIESVEAEGRGKMKELTERIEHGVKRAVDRLPQSPTKRQLEQIDAHVLDLEKRVQQLEATKLAEAEEVTI